MHQFFIFRVILVLLFRFRLPLFSRLVIFSTPPSWDFCLFLFDFSWIFWTLPLSFYVQLNSLSVFSDFLCASIRGFWLFSYHWRQLRLQSIFCNRKISTPCSKQLDPTGLFGIWLLLLAVIFSQVLWYICIKGSIKSIIWLFSVAVPWVWTGFHLLAC